MTPGGNLAFHQPLAHRGNAPKRESLAWDHPAGLAVPRCIFPGIFHTHIRQKQRISEGKGGRVGQRFGGIQVRSLAFVNQHICISKIRTFFFSYTERGTKHMQMFGYHGIKEMQMSLMIRTFNGKCPKAPCFHV